MKVLVSIALILSISMAKAQTITARQMLKIIALTDTAAIRKAILKKGFKAYGAVTPLKYKGYQMAFISKRRTKHAAGADSTNHTFVAYGQNVLGPKLTISIPTKYLRLVPKFGKLGFMGSRGRLQTGHTYYKRVANQPCYKLVIPYFDAEYLVTYELTKCD